MENLLGQLLVTPAPEPMTEQEVIAWAIGILLTTLAGAIFVHHAG
ncbi:hypothetical protein [Kiloniella sp.]